MVNKPGAFWDTAVSTLSTSSCWVTAGAGGSLGAELGEGTQGQTQPGAVGQGHGDGMGWGHQLTARWAVAGLETMLAEPGLSRHTSMGLPTTAIANGLMWSQTNEGRESHGL